MADVLGGLLGLGPWSLRARIGVRSHAALCLGQDPQLCGKEESWISVSWDRVVAPRPVPLFEKGPCESLGSRTGLWFGILF